MLVAGSALAKPVSPYGTAGFTGIAAPRTAAAPGAEDALPLGAPQYNTTLVPLPPNSTSLGFHATGTSEFGDLVRLSGAAHYIDSVTVTMSSWAIRSDYPADTGSAFGFNHPITLKLYAVDRRGGLPKPGALLVTVTRSFLIPWRPEPDTVSTSPLRPWRAADGAHYTGLAFNVTFELGALARSLPDEIVFSVSFDTQSQGAAPLGRPGPYDALHLALGDQPPAPGADVEPGVVFWKTAAAAHYADRGSAGTNQLRRDAGWASLQPAVRFSNSAYGTLLEASILLGRLGSADQRHDAALADADAFLAQALHRNLWDGNNRLHSGFGRFAFNLIAAAVEELAGIVGSSDPVAPEAGRTIDLLLDASAAIAEISLGDAIIGAGHPEHLSNAQGALEDAHDHEGHDRFAAAIDGYGTAWRETLAALRN